MPQIVSFERFGGPEVLALHDVEVPEPGASEVRLSIEAIGVNRLDLMVRAGQSPRPIDLPARLGIEATGTIDAVGAGISGLGIGDPVLIAALPEMATNGSYAESLLIDADRVIPRPAELDAVSAAAYWVSYSTAYGALVERGGMRPGDHVLITAASSGVGLAAIQVARQLGAIPLAVTRTGAKREALLAAGAEAVIVTAESEVAGAARELTGGVGVELILDSVMGPGLAELAHAAAFGGTVVAVGFLDPRPTPFPAVAPLTIHRYMGFQHTLDPVVVHRMAAALNAGVAAGVLTPRVDSTFALADVDRAHEHLETGGQQLGKVVLTL